MPYYHTCRQCGANLNLGEPCDCRMVKLFGSKQKPGDLAQQPGTPNKIDKKGSIIIPAASPSCKKEDY